VSNRGWVHSASALEEWIGDRGRGEGKGDHNDTGTRRVCRGSVWHVVSPGVVGLVLAEVTEMAAMAGLATPPVFLTCEALILVQAPRHSAGAPTQTKMAHYPMRVSSVSRFLSRMEQILEVKETSLPSSKGRSPQTETCSLP
jgi:hypothetical protein